MTGLRKLKAILADICESGPLVIAFSGGLDSRFLAHVALEVSPKRVRLLHATGPHMALAETVRAAAWAAAQSAVFEQVAVNPLLVSPVRENSRDRCYHCKLRLFQHLLRHAERAVVVDGSNASDAQGYRPGLKALAELKIRSPLMEAGLTKPEIHALAAELGLAEPWQRARPCLLTRFPYDSPIDEAILRELEALEARVEQVLGNGPDSPDFRLRVVAEGFLLQIQHTNEAYATAVMQALPQLSVTLIPIVSGYHDQGGAAS